MHNDYFDYDSPSITKAQYAGTAGRRVRPQGRDFAYLGSVPLSTPFRYAGHRLQPARDHGRACSTPIANYAQYYKFAVNIAARTTSTA